MGIMVVFICSKCSYRSPPITLGPAPHPEEFEPVLATCGRCKQLMTVNVHDVTKKCPTCGDSVAVVPDESRVRCPVCNKRLKGESAGYWD